MSDFLEMVDTSGQRKLPFIDFDLGLSRSALSVRLACGSLGISSGYSLSHRLLPEDLYLEMLRIEQETFSIPVMSHSLNAHNFCVSRATESQGGTQEIFCPPPPPRHDSYPRGGGETSSGDVKGKDGPLPCLLYPAACLPPASPPPLLGDGERQVSQRLSKQPALLCSGLPGC